MINLIVTLLLLIVLLGADVLVAAAGAPGAPALALANPGAVLPIPVPAFAKYSGGPHKSGFLMGFITNRGVQYSSVDLGYSGTVIAPITGKLMIAKDCGDHQIAFIQAARAADGNGWALGLTHIYVNKGVRNTTVKQGQTIGRTVPPRPKPGVGCGYGSGSHIHFTLMRWRMATNGPVFTEQSISNTYLAQWIVKDTYLDGPRNDVALGGMIRDLAKITSVRSGKVIDAWTAGIQIWTYGSTNNNQKWILIPAPNDPGYRFLRSLGRGKCMVAPDGNDGTLITLATCGAENQKFKFTAVPGVPGKIAIEAKASGKVLDVITDWSNPNSGKANGTRIQLWSPLFGNNQQWVVSAQ
jgi:hypothetical protein